jgi:hypothetical protein
MVISEQIICAVIYFIAVLKSRGARGSVIGWGNMLQAGRWRVLIPMRCFFFNWPNPSSRARFLVSTQPLTEMSTRNLLGGVKGGRRIRLTTLPSVRRLSRKMWEPRPLTTLWAFTACYRDNFYLNLAVLSGRFTIIYFDDRYKWGAHALVYCALKYNTVYW